jgi:hypothetical protein
MPAMERLIRGSARAIPVGLQPLQAPRPEPASQAAERRERRSSEAGSRSGGARRGFECRAAMSEAHWCGSASGCFDRFARLPDRWVRRVGFALGDLLWWLARGRRDIALTNLALCFPQRTEDAATRDRAWPFPLLCGQLRRALHPVARAGRADLPAGPAHRQAPFRCAFRQAADRPGAARRSPLRGRLRPVAGGRAGDAAAGVDFRYRIFNADGGEVEQCGNGARCFVRYVHDKGLTKQREIRVETRSGIITLRLRADGLVTVDMGVPELAPAKIPFLSASDAVVQPLQVGAHAGDHRAVDG